MNAHRARAALAAFAFASLTCAAAGADERATLIARWVTASRPAPQLRAQLDRPQSAATPPADLAALAAAELREPGRYRLTEKAEEPKKSFLQRVWEWLGDRVNDLWQALFGRVRIGRGGAIAFGDVLVAVCALALAGGIWRLIAVTQFGGRRAATPSHRLDDEPDVRAAYERARTAARAGDFALASRLLFVATVLALDLRGVVARDPSATVGDLRRALRSRDGALVPGFDAVAAPFVRSAYAERPVASGDWERAQGAFLSILPEETSA